MRTLHIKVLKRLLMLLFPHIDLKFFRPFVSNLFKWVKDWGIIHTIKYYKQMRLHCTRYICGQPLLTNTMSIGLTKDGWPKKLLFLKKLADSGITSNLKFVLTILNFSRSFTLKKDEWNKVEPNFSSITDPPKGNYIIPGGFINSFVKKHSLKRNPPVFSKALLYLSMKAGPDGPATLTSYHNLLQYSYEEIQSIFNITDENGADFFSKSYKYAWDNNLYATKSKTNGVLSYVKDPEAKLRIIAISDYYTQLFLKPIHNIILFILRGSFNICDRTFTQDPMHKWEENEHSFWSLDLSSATDRFPIDLQRRLLVRIFNEKFAHSWSYLLSNRKFTTPNGGTVKYSTGQPMGTYSSWAVFTLTHHLVVHYCAFLEGYKDFNQYIILGDDIVIKNDKVAKRYIDIISLLGVEVSLNKTHVSKDTYEFAKRWIKPLQKKEITGVPLKGIINNFMVPHVVFIILYDYFKIKGNLYLSKYNLVELLFRLYYKFSIIKNTNKTIKKNSLKKIIPKMNFISLNKNKLIMIKALGLSLDIDFGYYSYDKLRNLFTILVKNDDYPIPGEGVALLEYKRILSQGMAGIIGKINNSIINNPDLLLSKFEIEDKNLLSDNPIFLSIYNTIKQSWLIVQTWDLSDDIILHNASKEIQDLDIENIFNKDRNKIRSLMTIGSIIRGGFRILNNTHEIYYGSSTTESTFTAPNDLIKSLQLNFNNDVLESIMRNEWKEPLKQDISSYISAWENLKL
nr:MAG: RNA-dependent RNA polymerase [Mitovirus sp.]